MAKHYTAASSRRNPVSKERFAKLTATIDSLRNVCFAQRSCDSRASADPGA
jgi:hypothetical protein